MSDGQFSRGRAALAVVPTQKPAQGPTTWFCSNCGVQPDDGADQQRSRVCESCGLGVLLETRADAAPHDGGAFMVLDRTLAVTPVASWTELISSHPKRTRTVGCASTNVRRSGSRVYCEMS